MAKVDPKDVEIESPDTPNDLGETRAGPALSRMDKIVDYLRQTPRRVAGSMTSTDLVPAMSMGATYNAMPRLSAAVETLPAIVRNAIGASSESIPGAYNDALRRLQPLYAGAAEREPVANLIGAVATPNPLAKAGVAARIGGAGLAGGLASYFSAPVDDANAQRVDGEYGALAGAGAQAAMEGVSPLLGRAARGLRTAAGERAVQAIGTRAGLTDRLAKMGIAPGDVPDMGNRLLDEGLVPSGLNPLRNPLQQTADRATAAMSSAGREVGDILGQADAASPTGFLFAEAARAAESPLRGMSTAAEDAAGKARALVDQIHRQQQVTPGSFRGANQLKSDAYRSVNWLDEAPMAAELHRKSVSGLRGSIESQVGRDLGQEAEASMVAANRRFGLAADADALATRAMSRDVQKQQFSPLRTAISAGLGMGAGGMAGGFGGAGAGSVLAPYLTGAIAARGPNVAAHANRAASKAAGSVAPHVNQFPSATGKAGDLLNQWLTKKPDDEREAEGAAYFTEATGGR